MTPWPVIKLVMVGIRAVSKLLRAWYDVWYRDVNQTHKEQYYSMLLKCLAWINGEALEQYEVVKPVILSKYATQDGYGV